MRGVTEVRNLKELGVLLGGGFVRDNTRKHTTDLNNLSIVNCKFNGMSGVEGKLKKRARCEYAKSARRYSLVPISILTGASSLVSQVGPVNLPGSGKSNTFLRL